jgi:hypothetical protein
MTGGFLGVSTDIELREFRAEVGNEFLQMERVRVHRNLDPVVFLHYYAGTIDAFCPYFDDALTVLADDFECFAEEVERFGPETASDYPGLVRMV